LNEYANETDDVLSRLKASLEATRQQTIEQLLEKLRVAELPEKEPKPKWEYLTQPVTTDIGYDFVGDATLNALGAEGWELVSVGLCATGLYGRIEATAFFKRRVQDTGNG